MFKKKLLSSLLSLISLWMSNFCVATDDKENPSQYTCLYLRESVEPAEEDPFKERPKTLSPDLIEKIKEKSPERVPFYETLGRDQASNLSTDSRKKVGPFLIDYQILLGKGEQGEVYLAQDQRSGVFTAVKISYIYTQVTKEIEERSEEYQAFLALQRCFGFYAEKPQSSHCFTTYLFTPLIEGKDVYHYWWSPAKLLGVDYDEKTNIVTYKNLLGNVKLVRSIVEELRYLFKNSVCQNDINNTNAMFTFNENHKQFSLVDILLASKDIHSEFQYQVSSYLIFTYYALGIRDLITKDNFTLKAGVPQPVMNFFLATRPNEPGKSFSGTPFSLKELDKAVTNLEKESL